MEADAKATPQAPDDADLHSAGGVHADSQAVQPRPAQVVAAAPRPRFESRLAPAGAAALRPLFLFAVLIASWAFAKSWSYASRWPCIDYYQFWVVGDALRAGDVGDVYSQAERKRLGEKYAEIAQRDFGDAAPERAGSRRRGAAIVRTELETYSTPALYALFAVTGTGRYRYDLTLFQRLSLCSYVAALLIVCGLLGYSLVAKGLVVATLLEAFGPLLEDESFGNVSRLQLALLALLMWLLAKGRVRVRFAAAGVLLGVSIALKPNVAAVAVLLGVAWIVTRQWRKLIHVVAGALAGLTAAVAASSAYYGSSACWRQWIRSLSSLMRSGGWDDVNFSLPRALHQLFGFEHVGWVALAVFALVLVLLFIGRRSIGDAVARGDSASASAVKRWDVFLVGLGGTVTVLSSELAWFHYYLLVLPLALYVLRPCNELVNRRNSRIVRALGFLALVAISLDAPRMLLDLPLASHLYVVVSGAVLLFAVGCWLCVAEARSPVAG
jgi:hypothetical protein